MVRLINYNVRGVKVKKLRLIKIAGLLVAGLLASADALAYTVDGNVVRDSSNVDSGSYIGDMGNVNIGLSSIGLTGVSPDAITTKYLSDGSVSYVGNDPAFNGVTTHWYQFSSVIPGTIGANYELGTDVTGFAVSFFLAGGSDTAIHTVPANAAMHFWDFFDRTNADDILMRIELDGQGPNQNYDVTLYAAAVPLPPAVLLFISALAGFGVIGRKKSRSV